MRLLGLRFQAVKRAIALRQEMVDTAAGWRLIQTAQHCDRVDWTPLQRWLHSNEASTPDNDNKVDVAESGGVRSYELHPRRCWNDSVKVRRQQFLASPARIEMQQLFKQEEERKRRRIGGKVPYTPFCG